MSITDDLDLYMSEDRRYRLLVDSVTDYAIYLLDPKGFVASWNPGARRFKGYDEFEIIGQHFSRFYTPEDREAGLPARALEIASEQGKFESEGWRIRKDGTLFWTSVVIDPVRAPSGSLIGFVKITRDLTERRAAQLALEEAQRALFQSQKMEAIGQLTGGIAHDFNNLLSAVSGSLELARKRLPDDPKLLRLINNAMQAAQRGAALTQRMLSFARRQELKPETLDLPSLVHGMSQLLQTSLGPLVTVETRFPINLPAVRVDANQLELSLLNLAVNARDAMPNGGPLVIAASEEHPPEATGLMPGRYVRLAVTDAGVGMDEATLLMAADPFFTTKGIGKGTGLGLSMVHGMAEQSGGKLVLKSKMGEGTTAELWLPATSIPGSLASTDAVSMEQVASARSLTILAVDDDALVLMNTGALIEDLGHTAVEATSGAKALDILRAGRKVDLVITDQAMPQMTGLQLAEAIRAEWPRLPIIIATGYAELPAESKATLTKLSKPFTQSYLGKAIAQAMEPEHSRA